MQLVVETQVHLETIDGEIVVFEISLFYAETYVCKKMVPKLMRSRLESRSRMDEGWNPWTQAEQQIELAWKSAWLLFWKRCKTGFWVITGEWPGTGKTTALNTIIRLFERHHFNIALAALLPGRARSDWAEATGREAKRRFTVCWRSELFGRINDHELCKSRRRSAGSGCGDHRWDVWVVDVFLMNGLLRAILPGTRLILVGCGSASIR